MSQIDPDFNLFQAFPSSRLLTSSFRIPVEQAVSAHFGKAWQVREFRDLNEFSSHPAAILSDGDASVFVKLSEAANGEDQFETELFGLRYLSEQARVAIPSPIGIVPADGGFLLVLECAQAVKRGPEQWRDIGRTLASIHKVKGSRHGFERQGYFGPLYQDNRPMKNWLEFYIERRLWPRLTGAIDSGNLTTGVIRMVETLINRLPGLDIPEAEPVLLHGDAQQNNFISTATCAVVIDPAVHYGNREMDLAYIDYFQPVPEDVFQGYQEILPIPPGFEERRDLWRVSALLAAVTVEGAGYVEKLVKATQRYL